VHTTVAVTAAAAAVICVFLRTSRCSSRVTKRTQARQTQGYCHRWVPKANCVQLRCLLKRSTQAFQCYVTEGISA
jgi:hypothetical protein